MNQNDRQKYQKPEKLKLVKSLFHPSMSIKMESSFSIHSLTGTTVYSVGEFLMITVSMPVCS